MDIDFDAIKRKQKRAQEKADAEALEAKRVSVIHKRTLPDHVLPEQCYGVKKIAKKTVFKWKKQKRPAKNSSTSGAITGKDYVPSSDDSKPF